MVVGQYIIGRMGGIVESVSFLEKLSLFNYMNTGAIISSGTFPVVDFFVLLGVAVLALAGSLVIFEKRELAF